MNRITAFVAKGSWLAGLAVFSVAWGAATASHMLRERERLDALQTETARTGVEVMSQTLNGNLMGALSLLGLVELEVKRDLQQGAVLNRPSIISVLESLGRSVDGGGVFLVGSDGIVRSSWDGAGKPSTGLNVNFRPYFQMAMQGKENVYSAVSLARGDRALYFSSPIHADNRESGSVIGVAVARTSLDKVDALLRDKADIALLLSPQGIVFASSRPEWVGFLSGALTPERLHAIRELKQFGNMFGEKPPSVLPVALNDGFHILDGRRFAIASSGVQWNDPQGTWRLVLLEDLSRTLGPGQDAAAAGVCGALLILLLLLTRAIFAGHARQLEAARQLQVYAEANAAAVERKGRLAAAGAEFQQAGDLRALAQVFLREANHLLGALQGTVYISGTSPDRLELAGSYGCAKEPPPFLIPGEGLLGQCAAERKIRILKVPEDGFWNISSGLGACRPAAVLTAPVLLQMELLGVVELALIREPDGTACGVLDELAGLLAISLEILRRNLRTGDMLAEKVESEKRISDQLCFQQALVDTIPYPLFFKGTDSRFLGVNRAYEEVFAVRRQDIIGKRVLDLDYLPEPDRLAYQAEDEQVIATVSTVQREMRIPFADGRVHDTVYFVSGFRLQDGAPGGLVGTFIDIKPLKDAERELARLGQVERSNQLAHCCSDEAQHDELLP